MNLHIFDNITNNIVQRNEKTRTHTHKPKKHVPFISFEIFIFLWYNTYIQTYNFILANEYNKLFAIQRIKLFRIKIKIIAMYILEIAERIVIEQNLYILRRAVF